MREGEEKEREIHNSQWLQNTSPMDAKTEEQHFQNAEG